MYYILYQIYFAFRRIDHYLNWGFLSRVRSRYDELFDMYLNTICRKAFGRFGVRKSGVTKKKRKQKVIVSLTSFPARIETVWLTIETLFRQSVKADEVILWLAETQFDGFESLPERLRRQCERGLTIRFCDDLRSHKKYYYAFQEHKEDMVITVDDDQFYPKDTIKRLLKLHKKYPEDVVCMHAQKVPENIAEPPSAWPHWPDRQKHSVHSAHTQAFTGGGGGTLFMPKLFDNVLYNKKLLLELAPSADDLWVYIVGRYSGIYVTSALRGFPVAIWGTYKNALCNTNNGVGALNDIQWQKLIAWIKQYNAMHT